MAALLLFGAGCEGADETGAGGSQPKGPQAITIQFAAREGAAAVGCGQSLGTLGAEGGDAKLRDLRYFVHDIRLVTADGVEAPVELDQDGVWQFQNVALLDFEDATGACEHGTPETHEVVTGKVDAGVYTGVRFRLGVPFELNHGDPTAAAPPLDDSGLYWGWGEGFMFFQIVTMTTPPSGDKDNAFAFALASMGCEGDPLHGEVVSCAQPNRPEIALTSFDAATQAIVLDVTSVFDGLNLLTQKGCASTPKNQECVPIFSRFGLDYATGGATPATQTVFRVAPR